MQKHMQLLVHVLLNTLVDRDNKLISFVLGQLSLRINNWLNARVDKLLLKHVEILELVLLIHKIVL